MWTTLFAAALAASVCFSAVNLASEINKVRHGADAASTSSVQTLPGSDRGTISARGRATASYKAITDAEPRTLTR